MSDEQQPVEPASQIAFGDTEQISSVLHEISNFENSLENNVKGLYVDDGNRDKALPKVFDDVLKLIEFHRLTRGVLRKQWKLLLGYALALYTALGKMAQYADSWSEELGERLYDMRKNPDNPDYKDLDKTAKMVTTDISIAKTFCSAFEKQIHTVNNVKKDEPVEGD